jgi:hypothetical protein
MNTLESLLSDLGITLETLLVGYHPANPKAVKSNGSGWTNAHFEWRVTLRRASTDQAFTTVYRCGTGHAKPQPDYLFPRSEESWLKRPGTAIPPTAASVVACLMSDAQCGADTFEDFCSNCGYDTDSRRALDIYLTCQQTATAMRRMLRADFERVAEAATEY